MSSCSHTFAHIGLSQHSHELTSTRTELTPAHALLTCTRVHMAALTRATPMLTHRMPDSQTHASTGWTPRSVMGSGERGAHCASSSSWADPGARSLFSPGGQKGDPSRAENLLSREAHFWLPVCMSPSTPGGSYRRSWLSPLCRSTLPAFLSNQTEPVS